MKNNYVLAIVIGGIFLSLMTLFALGLLNQDPHKLNLATKGKPIPAFELPDLLSDNTIKNSDFVTTKGYYVVNFWATWCPECYKEHPFLMQLSDATPIYGVNWKDNSEDARRYLRKLGNPFKKMLVDKNSFLAIGMGVYGAPETFLVSADGKIIHRYAGALNSAIWKKEFLPKIQALKQAQNQ